MTDLEKELQLLESKPEAKPRKMCFWPWDHDWPVWKDTYITTPNTKVSGQSRYCKVCNKKQARYVFK